MRVIIGSRRTVKIGQCLFGVAVVSVLALIACAPAPPPYPPVVPIPEDQIIVRPIFETPEDVPTPLAGMDAPAILLDPYDPSTKQLIQIFQKNCEKETLEQLLREGCQLSAEHKPVSEDMWLEALRESDAYVWFQPQWSDHLLPGPWSEVGYLDEDRDLFLDWYLNARSDILLQPTVSE